MKELENFYSSLHNLKEIHLYSPPYDTVISSGIIGLFKISFDLCILSIKEILHDHGYAESQTGSPRQILKTAYQAGMIKDEDLWLSALVHRNNVAHAYNKDIALDIVHATKDHFYSMFVELKEEIENNWL